MLVVEVPHDFITTSSSSHSQTPEAQTISEGSPFQADGTSSESSTSPKWPKMNDSGKDVKSVRLDISFKSPSHTGLQTSELVTTVYGQLDILHLPRDELRYCIISFLLCYSVSIIFLSMSVLPFLFVERILSLYLTRLIKG